MLLFRVLVLVVLMLTSSSASGQFQPRATGPYASESDYFADKSKATTYISHRDSMGLIRSVELIVEDDVDGGCWTSATASKAKIRVELERSGIAVFDEPLAFHTPTAPTMTLSVLGMRTGGANGICAGSAILETEFVAGEELGSLSVVGRVFVVSSPARGWRRQTIYTSGSTLDDQIADFVAESLDQFVADVLSARRSDSIKLFESLWPRSDPMTEAELDSLMAGAPTN